MTELKSHHVRVATFREASLRGWQDVMAPREGIDDLILVEYSQKHSREFCLHQAKRMASLLQIDLVEINCMTPGRWCHIADAHMLSTNSSLEGVHDEL